MSKPTKIAGAAESGSDAPICSPSSDTPETDAGLLGGIAASHAITHADFARRLERERNDALRDRDEWKASAAQYHSANQWLDEERSKLLQAIRKMRPDHPILPENAEVSHGRSTTNTESE